MPSGGASRGNSGWGLLLGSVGVALLIVLAVMLLVWLYRRRNGARKSAVGKNKLPPAAYMMSAGNHHTDHDHRCLADVVSVASKLVLLNC